MGQAEVQGRSLHHQLEGLGSGVQRLAAWSPVTATVASPAPRGEQADLPAGARRAPRDAPSPGRTADRASCGGRLTVHSGEAEDRADAGQSHTRPAAGTGGSGLSRRFP